MKRTVVMCQETRFSANALDGLKVSSPEELWNKIVGKDTIGKYTSISLDYDYDCGDSPYYTVYGIRQETDKEFSNRKKANAAMKKRQELERIKEEELKVKREKALLEELKKKYEV